MRRTAICRKTSIGRLPVGMNVATRLARMLVLQVGSVYWAFISKMAIWFFSNSVVLRQSAVVLDRFQESAVHVVASDLIPAGERLDPSCKVALERNGAAVGLVEDQQQALPGCT